MESSGPGISLKVDVREDEEQYVKLEACVELFVASGYFRARMKGLPAFDKIVGGLAWAIEICNYDADINIFHDSLTIGQKIAITENIVETLNTRMECPHRIEPHQIQGLDFIHIYPVVQWLVKKVFEHRAAVAARVRASGVEQFNRIVDNSSIIAQHFKKNDTRSFGIDLNPAATESLSSSAALRFFKWTARDAELEKLPDDADDDKLVRMTLLEYNSSDRPNSAATAADPTAKNPAEDELLQKLRTDGSLIKTGQKKIRAAKIGHLLAESSSSIDKLSLEYAAEQQRLKDEGDFAATPAQKLRLLEKRIAAHRQRIGGLQQTERELNQRHTLIVDNLTAASNLREEVQQRLHAIDAQITKNSSTSSLDITTIDSKVKQYESLKLKNQHFKKEFNRRAAEMQAELESLQIQIDKRQQSNDNTVQQQLFQQQVSDAEHALSVSRAALAGISLELGVVQRQLDAVPSSAEISQYQRRFLELYEEVNTWHRQLRQLYSIYNQSQDTLKFYEKQISLFDSINDNFRSIIYNESIGDIASRRSLRDNLLTQLRETLECVLRNVAGAEAALSKTSAKREQASRDYAARLEEQRRYASMLRQFQRECTRNEKLVNEINNYATAADAETKHRE